MSNSLIDARWGNCFFINNRVLGIFWIDKYFKWLFPIGLLKFKCVHQKTERFKNPSPGANITFIKPLRARWHFEEIFGTSDLPWLVPTVTWNSGLVAPVLGAAPGDQTIPGCDPTSGSLQGSSLTIAMTVTPPGPSSHIPLWDICHLDNVSIAFKMKVF